MDRAMGVVEDGEVKAVGAGEGGSIRVVGQGRRPFRVYLRVYLQLVHPETSCDRMRRSASMILAIYQ